MRKSMGADHWKIDLKQQINNLAGIVIGSNVEKRGWAWNMNMGLSNSLYSVGETGL